MTPQLRTVSRLVMLVVFSTLITGSLPLTCWDFNTGTSNWVNNGTLSDSYDWKWSTTSEGADTTNIPSFYSTSGYMFFQDQNTPPVQGSVYSPGPVYLSSGSQIILTVFRHIIDTHLNDSARPLLRFIETSGVSHNIEFDYNYDRWDDVVATCGVTSICCTSTTTSCPGHFSLDGVVYVRDELIAVDRVCYEP